jgi:UDP-N-acetylmuramoyl-tripeptide--D-alanyl-D-alanine ligase
MTVFNNLMRYKEFAGYLIPSETVRSGQHLSALLAKYSDIVLKPSSGHQGRNVYRLREGGEITAPVLNLIEAEEMIAQRYINCRTKSGDPYDLRLHVQKGRAGEWICAYIYPRISPSGNIVCNIKQGGYTTGLEDFLVREFGPGHIDMRKYLEVFSLQLAGHLDEIQRELYGEELDELGIDVGLDEEGKLYIYEVNWRPGHPPYANANLGIIKNTVRYAMYLAESSNL